MIINRSVWIVEVHEKKVPEDEIMDKKEDRRIAMTRRMLKDALISMLKEKDIYHISIRELCEKADVNRTTFYKYYGSQFDLLADMEKDILDFISNTLIHNETDPVKAIFSACRYMEENLEFIRLIINNNVDPSFAHKLFSMESIRESALKRYKGLRSESELEYIYNFLTYGAFRMFCVWLNRDDREPAEDFTQLVSQILFID